MHYVFLLALMSVLSTTACSGEELASVPSIGPSTEFVSLKDLDCLLRDISPYKFDLPGCQHEGDLLGHSVWAANAAVRLLESNEPYLQNLALTEREKKLFVLAALLHDVGKAGRIELATYAHPKLSYEIVEAGESVGILYKPDLQEHTTVGFEYIASSFFTPKNLPYFGRSYIMLDGTKFDFNGMFKELGLTEEEQKLVAVLVAIHWDFGRIGLGQMTNAEFIEKIHSLCNACNALFPVDKKLVQLCVLIQVADVYAIFYQPPVESTFGFPSLDVPRARFVSDTGVDILLDYGYKASPEKPDYVPAHDVFNKLMVYCDILFDSTQGFLDSGVSVSELDGLL
jgi:hypothetical protein